MTDGRLKEAIDSNTLNTLQSILQQWCLLHHCQQACPEAQVKARQLVDWFEAGIQSSEDLAALLDEAIAA